MKQKKKNKLIVLEKEKKQTDQKSARYFFKYAFPCAQVKVRLGSLNLEEYHKLKEIFLKNQYPDKESLERIFPPAFRRIKKLAEKIGREMWDFDTIQMYWTKEHNRIINIGDGMYGIASEDFKDLCKIHEAEVIKVEKNKLVVKYDEKERIVSNFLVQDAEVRDKVRIHFAFAIEEI